MYNSNSSSTYSYLSSDFQISYADGTGASGDYVSDTLNIGGASVKKLQMGVGYVSSSSEGVMGIGYPALEVQAQNNGRTPYPNVPQAMADQGLIKTPAFSLWLDDLASSTGSILFGGVDTAKFSGNLVSMNVVQENGQFLEMIIPMNGLQISSASSSQTVTSSSISVLLDSGSTLSYLPTKVAQKIYTNLGVTWSDADQTAYCPCSLGQSSKTIDFQFNGVTIPVRLSEMVLAGGVSASLDCTFGIFEQSGSVSSSTFTLGDTFIRNAYIVYDLHNNQISMAPTNFSPSGSNILEISNSVNAIAGAAAASSAGDSGVAATATGAAGTSGASKYVVNFGLLWLWVGAGLTFVFCV
jgi:hypothetical protein